MVKILFVYEFEYYEPLGMLYLSSMLKKEGYECDFVDIKFEKDMIRKVSEIKPQIILYSLTTGKHLKYKKINNELKQNFKFTSVFGGPHCTFFPDFINEDGVDVVARGECEQALIELVKGINEKRDITKIKNLWIKQDGKIYKNELRGLVEDLDSLPHPDRFLMTKYPIYKNFRKKYVIAGRGCPYQCTYCFNKVFNKIYKGKGGMIRLRSLDNLFDELHQIKNGHETKLFHFSDDTFILNKKWVLEFCKRYKEEIGIPFSCHLRCNLVDEEIVKGLSEAGCHSVFYAIECGNEKLRNDVLKRNMSDEQIIKTSSLCHKYGIKTFVQNIVGLPDETLDNVFETIRLNIKCKPDYAWFSLFQPYPGTELCDYSIQKGYFSGDSNSLSHTFFKDSVMKLKDIDKIIRLHHLGSVCVAFPFILPLVKRLINLPLDTLYHKVWNVHRIWCYYFKNQWFRLIRLSDMVWLMLNKKNST